MSRFPKREPVEAPRIVGTVMHGAFECQTCGTVSTDAVHDRQEDRLHWQCPNGHESSITFRL